MWTEGNKKTRGNMNNFWKQSTEIIADEMALSAGSTSKQQTKGRNALHDHKDMPENNQF